MGRPVMLMIEDRDVKGFTWAIAPALTSLGYLLILLVSIFPFWVRLVNEESQEVFFSGLFENCFHIKCWKPRPLSIYVILGRVSLLSAVVLSFLTTFIMVSFASQLFPRTRKHNFVSAFISFLTEPSNFNRLTKALPWEAPIRWRRWNAHSGKTRLTVTQSVTPRGPSGVSPGHRHRGYPGKGFLGGACAFLALLLHALEIQSLRMKPSPPQFSIQWPYYVLGFSILLFMVAGAICLIQEIACPRCHVLPISHSTEDTQEISYLENLDSLGGELSSTQKETLLKEETII